MLKKPMVNSLNIEPVTEPVNADEIEITKSKLPRNNEDVNSEIATVYGKRLVSNTH